MICGYNIYKTNIRLQKTKKGVAMSSNNYSHISISERKRIEQKWDNGRGESIRVIATMLGRSPSTISREIRRNSVIAYEEKTNFKNPNSTIVIPKNSPKYIASEANHVCNLRSRNSHRALRIKGWLMHLIIRYLHAGVSPELICIRMQYLHGIKLHFETIYSFIYAPANEHFALWEYLTKAHPKRRAKHKKQGCLGKIPRRTSIHDRPAEIETRKVFGHWEGDSVVSGAVQKGGIHTERERKTRYIFAKHISTTTAAETAETALGIFSVLPAGARISVTLDNGVEMYEHFRLIDELNMKTYFADPYSSCQRGTNENGNGLIRRFFPKKTDFSLVTEEDLFEAVNHWNNRPMKCLGGMTPQEAFDEELKKLLSKEA